jgi:uncharacterized protein with NRDE domain
MCIIVFRWTPNAESPLQLIANRDEFFARPAAPMQWWNGGDVLAGRDLKSGGTWLGVTKTGRFAAITNIRSPAFRKSDAPSRGALVSDFLSSELSAANYIDSVALRASAYEGFNLLCGDMNLRELWFLNSQERVPRAIVDGVYGLSNATLDAPWPKVVALKSQFVAMAPPREDGVWRAEAQSLLLDTAVVPDQYLPNTGVPIDWERALSAVFIRHQNYGTRASTVLRIDAQNVKISEQTHRLNAKWNGAMPQILSAFSHFKFDISAPGGHL